MPTIREISAEIAQLRNRVEDLEDALDLDAAIRRNADKRLIPWQLAKKEIGLWPFPIRRRQ